MSTPNKPDNVVISILNSLYPDIQFIADNGDGVHLKTVFLNMAKHNLLVESRKNDSSFFGKNI